MEKENKNYKDLELILLNTKGPSTLVLKNDELIYDGITSTLGGENLKYLFAVTTEKFYYGDWLINPNGFPEIFGPDWGAKWSLEEILKCKKIICSKSNLPLPTLPHFFIKKYVEEFNKGNKINTVTVEFYEDGFLQYDSNELGVDWESERDMTGHPITYRRGNKDMVKIKIDLNENIVKENQILIEMWKENESFVKYGGVNPQSFDSWLKDVM